MILDKVLERLEEKGVKLRAEKCVFGKREVPYLGHLVSAEGYRPDPADTAALQKFTEPPKNVGEVGESGQSGTMSRPQDVIFKHWISTLIFHFSTPPTILFHGSDLCSIFPGL